MRYLLPGVTLLGSAPTYLLAWTVWRVLSAFLPAWIYQRVDDRLYCLYQNTVPFFFENYTGVQILLYGDLPKHKENVIYLANHQSTLNWIVSDMLAAWQGALGHVRHALKGRLKWLPLCGFYFAQRGGIYVKRSAKCNEKETRDKLQSYVNAGTPMHLVIFPEGTRYTPGQTKLAATQALAAQPGLTVLKHVLTPRIKATYVAFDSLKSRLEAIYDVTVVYEGKNKDPSSLDAPSMTEFLCQQRSKLHILIDRIDTSEVPEGQECMKKWLHERFTINDTLLIEFYDSPDPERRQRFPGRSAHSRLSFKKTLPSVLMLSGLTIGMLTTEAGQKLYMGTCV